MKVIDYNQIWICRILPGVGGCQCQGRAHLATLPVSLPSCHTLPQSLALPPWLFLVAKQPLMASQHWQSHLPLLTTNTFGNDPTANYWSDSQPQLGIQCITTLHSACHHSSFCTFFQRYFQMNKIRIKKYASKLYKCRILCQMTPDLSRIYGFCNVHSHADPFIKVYKWSMSWRHLFQIQTYSLFTSYYPSTDWTLPSGVTGADKTTDCRTSLIDKFNSFVQFLL